MHSDGTCIHVMQAIAALRTREASCIEGIEELHGRHTAALVSAAEHERTAQQRQLELQKCRSVAAGLQERSDHWKVRDDDCTRNLATAAKGKQTAEIAARSAVQDISRHRKAALAATWREKAAVDAQAECMVRISGSQQVPWLHHSFCCAKEGDAYVLRSAVAHGTTLPSCLNPDRQSMDGWLRIICRS